MEIKGLSQRQLAVAVGAHLSTVQNWLRGGLPGEGFLDELGELFEVDPMDFLVDPFDMLYSYGMSLAFKILLGEQAGKYEVKITLSALVRLLKELNIFRELDDTDMDQPLESALQAILPALEEQAKAEAQQHVMALADKNFLKHLVNEHRAAIEELLSDDEPTDTSETANE